MAQRTSGNKNKKEWTSKQEKVGEKTGKDFAFNTLIFHLTLQFPTE
jgi:hypothetical protein